MLPTQMADMQRQMANLPSGFVQQQMQAMNTMPPEVLRQRMAEASRADPAQVQANLKQATSTAQQQEEYQARQRAPQHDPTHARAGRLQYSPRQYIHPS